MDLTHKNWKEQIEGACSSGLLYFRLGSCSVVRVGKASMEAVELVENVVAAIHGVVECVPKKWGGVRSFHVKFSESLALPVYQAVPDVKLKIEGVKEICEGEVKVKAVEKLGRENVGVKKLVKNKKGRIHEVRYMDGEVGGYEDEFLDDLGDIEGEESEDDDVGHSEFGGKKRKKKGESVVGEKRLKKSGKKANMEGEKSGDDDVMKTKKKKIGEKRLKESVSMGEEFGEKEAKGGVGKSKHGASKLKSKKNK